MHRGILDFFTGGRILLQVLREAFERPRDFLFPFRAVGLGGPGPGAFAALDPGLIAFPACAGGNGRQSPDPRERVHEERAKEHAVSVTSPLLATKLAIRQRAAASCLTSFGWTDL